MITESLETKRARKPAVRVRQTKMLIDGDWVESVSGKTFPTIGPRSQTPFGNAIVPATLLPSHGLQSELSCPESPHGDWRDAVSRRWVRATELRGQVRAQTEFGHEECIGRCRV